MVFEAPALSSAAHLAALSPATGDPGVHPAVFVLLAVAVVVLGVTIFLSLRHKK